MTHITFNTEKPFDMILLGRVAIDLNPVDAYKTLAESAVYKKYVGGSPANIAVGLSAWGKSAAFSPGFPTTGSANLW